MFGRARIPTAARTSWRRSCLPRPLCAWRPPRYEDELTAGPVRGVPDLVGSESGGRQRIENRVPATEPQRRVRRQHRAIGVEDTGGPERHELATDLDEVFPRLDAADAWNHRLDVA